MGVLGGPEKSPKFHENLEKTPKFPNPRYLGGNPKNTSENGRLASLGDKLGVFGLFKSQGVWLSKISKGGFGLYPLPWPSLIFEK